MICSNCKKEISNDAKFCNLCGKPVKEQVNKEQIGSVDLYFKKQEDELLELAKKMANREMLKGIGWFVGALLITGITYAMAEGGGTYYIFWGAMIFGGYMFLRGLYYKVFPRQLLKKNSESTGK